MFPFCLNCKFQFFDFVFIHIMYKWLKVLTCDKPNLLINMTNQSISCLSDWTICGFDSDRKPCLYPITWPCLSPITWSTGIRSYNGTYLLFRRLQYMLIQYRVSNWTIFWLHNDRKSFLSSFLPVTSSWMRTYTSCDDVTRWRQAAFAYAVNMSNALQTEKHLIEMGFKKEIGKINN